MFTFAVFVGIYSYIIFFLGILGILYRHLIIGITVIFVIVGIFWQRNWIQSLLDVSTISWRKQKLFLVLLILFLLQALVNLLGVFGQELGFDALWYHLTLPKLYLAHHTISFIPGGLLYYSAMPKVAEMLYTAALSMGNEITAKLVHFSFGLLTCLVIYKLSRKFFNQTLSMLAVIIFYSNLVVDWESITAYIDLIRAFFEILALYTFIEWYQTRKEIFLFQMTVFLGLAITTKVLALGSMPIFLVLMGCIYWIPAFAGMTNEAGMTDESGGKINNKVGEIALYKKNKYIGIFVLLTLLIPLPWFIFSFIHTRNPVYPFFTKLYSVPFSFQLLNPLVFISRLWNLFTHAADPISPIYTMFVPLIIYYFPMLRKEIKVISIYSFLSVLIWYFTPDTGGGRFILPYLPAFSIVCAGAVSELGIKKSHFVKTSRDKQELRIKGIRNYNFLQKYIIGTIIFVALLSIGYRFVANVKYLPVIFGRESKGEFLAKRLNFSYGDFYDTDGYFAKHIKASDRVLLYGFHNLYYVDFPFVDSSWLQESDRFDYIATQHFKLPKQFANWKKVYENRLTGIELYNK